MSKRKQLMLSPHFSYEEMTRSVWTQKHHVDNTPDDLQLAALINICWKLGEPLREVFGPIYVNSGFRNETVNTGVHGVGNSKHLSGEAMDIRIDSANQVRIIFENGRKDDVFVTYFTLAPKHRIMGSVLIIILLFFLIGRAIDSDVLYNTRAKIQTYSHLDK